LLPEPYLLSGSYILVSEWCGDVGSIGSDNYLLDGGRVFSRVCANSIAVGFLPGTQKSIRV
jgi:hypothetical protein